MSLLIHISRDQKAFGTDPVENCYLLSRFFSMLLNIYMAKALYQHNKSTYKNIFKAAKLIFTTEAIYVLLSVIVEVFPSMDYVTGFRKPLKYMCTGFDFFYYKIVIGENDNLIFVIIFWWIFYKTSQADLQSHDYKKKSNAKSKSNKGQDQVGEAQSSRMMATAGNVLRMIGACFAFRSIYCYTEEVLELWFEL